MPDGQSWSDLGFPVYPIVSDQDNSLKDMRIVNISVRQTDFESAPTTIIVSIDSVGLAKQKVVVQLARVDGKTIQEQTTDLDANDAAEVSFRFRPESSGVNFFKVSVFAESDRANVATDYLISTVSKQGEATLVNNRRVVTVNRDAGPYRVLYVAGRPNWEFKFLRRALDTDAEVQLVGLMRIANKEAKFSFRDRSVSDTNPLFAGLGKDEEEIASQYDEPVILRFGVKESEELSDGFPETDEELFAYHAVILDDIETEFFTQDQLLRLRRFVSSRGGGLLMLGGQESFASKSFGDSPLGELSPVYAPRTASMKPIIGRYGLTREGLLQPWARLRDTEQSETDRVETMPPFLTVNPVGDVKPGASNLATIALPQNLGSSASATAMAVQRFGKGRTAAIPIGDLWRWSMRRNTAESSKAKESLDRDDPGQAWRQTIHWLVGEVPKRVELRIEPSIDTSGPVTLLVSVRDEAFLPLDNAAVDLEITAVGGEAIKLTADADRSAAGVYRASYWPREPGGHLAIAKVQAADGSEVGIDASGWTSQRGAAEFADLRLNRKLLSQIAEQTGGQLIDQDSLGQFADDLPNRKIPVTETWVYPLWHRSWVLMVVIGCLCGEWGLRRWKGLA
ncbi:MAG: hypothetical protein WBD31_25380 [Rubripirellula sp.]